MKEETHTKDASGIIIEAIIIFAVGMFLFGPPLYIVLSEWGEPLYVSKTVTKTITTHSGFLIDAVGSAVAWLLFAFMFIFTLMYGPKL